MSTEKEEILNKSIKEKLMNSQKIDNFWESFCDCISPDLNIINDIADEIKNLYDVDKTSNIKSIGEMFGYSPNLIIKNDKEYQKLEILSIPDRIRNKTTYTGYNLGIKQLNLNSETFNFYWDGKKLIRAIKQLDTFNNIVNWDKKSNFTEVVADKNYSDFSIQESLHLDNQEFLDNMRLDYSKYTIPTHHIGVEYVTTNNNKYKHFNTLKTNDGYKYFSYLFFIHEIDINSVIVTKNGEEIEPISYNNNNIQYENGYFDISQSYIEFNFDDNLEREIIVSYYSDKYFIDYLYFNYLNKCSVYNKRVPIIHHNGFQINDKIKFLTTDNNITSYLLPIDKINSLFMKLDNEFELDDDLILDKIITEKEQIDHNPRYISMGSKLNINIYPYDDDVAKISRYYSLTTLATDKGLTISEDITIEKLNNINLSISESMHLTSDSYMNLISSDLNYEFSFIIKSDGEIYNNNDLKIYSEQNKLYIVGKTQINLPLNYGDEHRIIIQKNENIYEIFIDNNDDYFIIESNNIELEKHYFGKYLSTSAEFYIWDLITREVHVPTNLILRYMMNDYKVIFNNVRNPIKVFELSDSEILSMNDKYMVNTILPYPQLEDSFYKNEYTFSEKPKSGSIVLIDEFDNELNENLSNDIVDSDNNIVGNYNDETSILTINKKITLVNNESFIENIKEEKILIKTVYRDNSFKYFDSDIEETNTVNELSTPIFINGKYKTTNGNIINRDGDTFYLNDKIIKPVYIDEYYNKVNFMIDNKFYDSFKENALNEILKVKLKEPYDTDYDIYSIDGNLYLYPELNENYRIRIWRIENTYDSTDVIVNDDHTFKINTVENVYYTYCYSLGNNVLELYDSLSFTRKKDVISDMEIVNLDLNELTMNYEVENWKIVTVKLEESKNESELIAYIDKEKLILEESSSVNGTKLNIEVNPLVLIIDEENYSVKCEIENSISQINTTIEYEPIDNKLKILYTTSNGVAKIIDSDNFGVIDDDYITGIYKFGTRELEVKLKDKTLSFVDFNCQYVYEIDNKYYDRHFILNYQLINPIDICEIGIYNKDMTLLSYTKFPYVELIDNSYISVCILLDYGV